jgi:hypothetical protein
VAEKKKTKFVISKESTVAIYNDGDRDMLDKIGGHEENRASHVDPLHPPAALAWLAFWRWPRLIAQYRAFKKYGPGHWAVYWLGEVKSWSPCFSDEAGQPFRTKQQAEIYEVARLERDFFLTRPKGALHLVSLELEQVNVSATNAARLSTGATTATGDQSGLSPSQG